MCCFCFVDSVLYFKCLVHQLHVYVTHVPENKRSVNPAREFFRRGIIFDGHFRYSGHSLCENSRRFDVERGSRIGLSTTSGSSCEKSFTLESEKRLVSENLLAALSARLIDFYFKFCPARGLFRNVRAIIVILRTATYTSTYSCYGQQEYMKGIATWI